MAISRTRQGPSDAASSTHFPAVTPTDIPASSNSTNDVVVSPTVQ
jgi:hypothetical protein